MQWKRYLQFNKFGPGDTYAWAYDEAVCAKGSQQSRGDHGYPWCRNSEARDAGAVDSAGNVVDSSCPCTVMNRIAPLGALPFRETGWGKHMFLHIYNVMSHKYKPPTSRVDYNAVTIPNTPEENNQFYLKVVN